MEQKGRDRLKKKYNCPELKKLGDAKKIIREDASPYPIGRFSGCCCSCPCKND